jgi:hypothetical protein
MRTLTGKKGHVMRSWGFILLGWIAAGLAAALTASIAHSLFVQAALSDIGVALPAHVRLATMVRDFLGLLPTLGPVLLGATGLGFLVAAFLRRRVGATLAALAWPLAGWAAVLLALVAMRLWFGFSPLAGARTTAGLLSISLSGLVAGFLFAWVRSLAQRRPAR